MNTAQKLIETFDNDFDNLVINENPEMIGSDGIYKYAIFSDGSALSGSDNEIWEVDADEAEAAIEQQ